MYDIPSRKYLLTIINNLSNCSKFKEVGVPPPIYIEEILDFSLKDIENCIRKNVREHQIKYVFNPQRVKGLCKTFPFINGVLLNK